jgi:hypothetical protein
MKPRLTRVFMVRIATDLQLRVNFKGLQTGCSSPKRPLQEALEEEISKRLHKIRLQVKPWCKESHQNGLI